MGAVAAARVRTHLTLNAVAYATLCVLSAAATLFAYVVLDVTPQDVPRDYRWVHWDRDVVVHSTAVLEVAGALAVVGVLTGARRGRFRIAGVVALCAATRLVVLLVLLW